MGYTQMTVEHKPAEENLIGLCFRNPPSTDTNARRFDIPRSYLGVEKRKTTMQTQVA